MTLFDANTLLQVSAAFHGFMALVWLLMSQVFRIAPTAALLLAAAYFAIIPALLCPDCHAWWPAALQGWLQKLLSLLGFSLMALGIRRMMRLRMRWLDIAGVAGLAALGMLACYASGHSAAALAATSAGMGLLTLLAAKDVQTGGRATLTDGVRRFLLLPYLLLAAMLLGRSVTLLWMNEQRPFFVQGEHASAWLAWAYLLLTLAIGIGLVGIVVTRLIDRIRYMTLRDPLTDTLNRRALGKELQTLQAQAERGQSHCLVMLDVDHFKRINDSLGHAAGDAALLHLVGVLRANMRDLDRLGRLGGEEFCVLLPHTSLADASRVAQRMCEALRRSPLVWREQALKLSASFGVAPCQSGDPQGEHSLALADWLVYRAKSEGRDRICVAEPGAALGRVLKP
jgi:diguanylate cyclase (GGDEF)-like protein